MKGTDCKSLMLDKQIHRQQPWRELHYTTSKQMWWRPTRCATVVGHLHDRPQTPTGCRQPLSDKDFIMKMCRSVHMSAWCLTKPERQFYLQAVRWGRDRSAVMLKEHLKNKFHWISFERLLNSDRDLMVHSSASRKLWNLYSNGHRGYLTEDSIFFINMFLAWNPQADIWWHVLVLSLQNV